MAMKVNYGGKQIHARFLRNRLNPIYRGRLQLMLDGLKNFLALELRARLAPQNCANMPSKFVAVTNGISSASKCALPQAICAFSASRSVFRSPLLSLTR